MAFIQTSPGWHELGCLSDFQTAPAGAAGDGLITTVDVGVGVTVGDGDGGGGGGGGGAVVVVVGVGVAVAVDVGVGIGGHSQPPSTSWQTQPARGLVPTHLAARESEGRPAPISPVSATAQTSPLEMILVVLPDGNLM